MIILTIRTDKPEAEIGIYNDTAQLAYKTWHAHRTLSVTLINDIRDILQGLGKTLTDIEGIVCYAGPGSFTGLRIGLTVADSLAYGLEQPIVGIVGAESWLERGIARLQAGENDVIALPEYGAPVHITTPKK